jgi:hypothetical protein
MAHVYKTVKFSQYLFRCQKEDAMNMNKLVLLVILVLFISGCSDSRLIVKQTDKAMLTPSEKSAVITFLRPSGYEANEPYSIWDSEILIGQLQGKELFHYEAPPGKHLFLARADTNVSGKWTYLRAELKSGKHYYAELRVYPQLTSSKGVRILNSLVPVNSRHEKELKLWLVECKQNELVNELAEKFYQANIGAVRDAIKKERVDALSNDMVLFNIFSADSYIE